MGRRGKAKSSSPSTSELYLPDQEISEHDSSSTLSSTGEIVAEILEAWADWRAADPSVKATKCFGARLPCKNRFQLPWCELLLRNRIDCRD